VYGCQLAKVKLNSIFRHPNAGEPSSFSTFHFPLRSFVNYSMNLIVFHQCGSHTGLTMLMMIMWKMNMQMGKAVRAECVLVSGVLRQRASRELLSISNFGGCGPQLWIPIRIWLSGIERSSDSGLNSLPKHKLNKENLLQPK